MFSQKKPYSAVTVDIERLTSEAVPVDDVSGIPDLVEVVNLQDTGPREASRAIRKKLKYGNLHRQLRALTLLDGLIQNAGPRFQRSFADEALLERLRFCGTAELSDPEVKKKCRELFASWAADQETPRRKRVVTQQESKVIRETENPFGEDEEEDDGKPGPAGPSGGHSRTSSLPSPLAKQPLSSSHDTKKSKKDKRTKRPKFNLAAEQEQMKIVIAEASIAATNLTNTLQTINRERERISDNQIAAHRFEECKQLRRKILRYIQHVEAEQWLGSLLNANDVSPSQNEGSLSGDEGSPSRNKRGPSKVKLTKVLGEGPYKNEGEKAGSSGAGGATQDTGEEVGGSGAGEATQDAGEKAGGSGAGEATQDAGEKAGGSGAGGATQDAGEEADGESDKILVGETEKEKKKRLKARAKAARKKKRAEEKAKKKAARADKREEVKKKIGNFMNAAFQGVGGHQ
ncbi:hypothetical protein CHGG_09211 [Chaetomium globosum CBS 148.51]|uniref:VHS domain-containing protein n=1 Tax=Chaetomium globosum (strain ATCC 6205 / CBS 148.51 / DSM 1962 / NBRC 6347 / NRRL 1970) TaxID=306901 RepID=Q2GS43_CHAGB|nr:uncharacterized protein CHGG_09211 [Chaetomium globosum CBS 148.51]EAQ85197.1 hypothetical protein CHGG_09211 [Chaetomium globosum CBS 148.51]